MTGQLDARATLRWALAAATLGLAACTTPEAAILPVGRTLVATPVAAPPPLDPALLGASGRGLAEQPFERGPMAIVAREGGRLQTYGLAACQGGRAVCAWAEGGPVGTATREDGWLVVRGLFGRTFWLSPGGDGWVQRGDQLWNLAWNARADGRGEGPFARPADGSENGTAAALETRAPHR